MCGWAKVIDDAFGSEGERRRGESIIGCCRRRNVAHQSKRREEGGRLVDGIDRKGEREAALENIRSQ